MTYRRRAWDQTLCRSPEQNFRFTHVLTTSRRVLQPAPWNPKRKKRKLTNPLRSRHWQLFSQELEDRDRYTEHTPVRVRVVIEELIEAPPVTLSLDVFAPVPAGHTIREDPH